MDKDKLEQMVEEAALEAVKISSKNMGASPIVPARAVVRPFVERIADLEVSEDNWRRAFRASEDKVFELRAQVSRMETDVTGADSERLRQRCADLEERIKGMDARADEISRLRTTIAVLAEMVGERGE